MKKILALFSLIILFTGLQAQPVRVGVVGFNHDHVGWILGRDKPGDIEVVGFVEPNRDLAKRYCKRFNLPIDKVFSTLEEMVNETHPEAVTAFNPIYQHVDVVRFCAPKGIHVMVEKPLATSVEDAKEMIRLAKEHHIKLLVNYETTWYGSNAEAYRIIHEEEQIGDIRKIIFHTGHRGPKEIGCSQEFLSWLTDPVMNGAGALTDFGCYGSNLATWLMLGEAPQSVSCITQHIKPDIYPKVEDEATIILTYPKTQVIIQASWNWPFNVKDMEVFGQRGFVKCLNGTDMKMKTTQHPQVRKFQADPLPEDRDDPFAYFARVVRDQVTMDPTDLSSPENNLTVMKILAAAKKSAETGETINWQEEYNLTSAAYHTHRRPLKNSFLKFTNQGTGRVVFLGGSITHNGGWRDSVCTWLEDHFPMTSFEFINAGIPSMGSVSGAFRFERDVLKDGPVDLLFVEAAVNDEAIKHKQDLIKRGMEGIVRHALISNPMCDVIMMHFVDPGKMKDYRAGRIPKVIRIHEGIADHYQVPTINLAREVTERIDNHEFTWKDDFKNLHPSPFGQGVYFRSITGFLQSAYSQTYRNGRRTRYKIPSAIYPGAFDQGKLVEPDQTFEADGWKWEMKWNPNNQVGKRANYIDVPMLVGQYPGDAVSFQFSGTAVGIAVAAGPDAGIIKYRLDKGPWQILDLFTPHSRYLYLPRYYTLGYQLVDKKHLLEIQLTDQQNEKSTGKACVLRYFYYQQ